MAIPARLRGSRNIASGATLLPILYIGYHASYLLIQTTRTAYTRGIRIRTLLGFALTIVLLAIIGTALVLTWERGLRVPVLLAGVELAVLPWLFPLKPLDTVKFHLVWVFTTIIVSAGVEGSIRAVQSESGLADDQGLQFEPRPPDRQAIRFGLAVGSLHLSIGVALQLLTRVGSLLPGSVFVWAIMLAGLVGATINGFVPSYLWKRSRLYAPAFVFSGWLLWAAVRITYRLGELPYTEFTAIRHTAIRPFPDYMLQWPILLLLLILTAAVEYSVQNWFTVTRPQ